MELGVREARVEYEKLTGKVEVESSAVTHSRVLAARKRQTRRFAGSERVRVNAEMGPAEVRKYCDVDAAAQRLQLSARAFHRVLKLARTITDLAGAEQIAAPHIAEALQYWLQVDAR